MRGKSILLLGVAAGVAFYLYKKATGIPANTSIAIIPASGGVSKTVAYSDITAWAGKDVAPGDTFKADANSTFTLFQDEVGNYYAKRTA